MTNVLGPSLVRCSSRVLFGMMIYVALEVIGNQPIQLFTRMCWFYNVSAHCLGIATLKFRFSPSRPSSTFHHLQQQTAGC